MSLTNFMKLIDKNFNEKNLIGKKLLRIALYSYFLWSSLLILMEREHFIGVNSFNFSHDFNAQNISDWLYYFFWNSDFHHLVESLIIVQSLILLSGIVFNISSHIYALICFLLTINVQNMFISLLHGGDQIGLLLFSLLPFINTSGVISLRGEKIYINNFKVVLSETFFLICKLQIAVLYFSSALFKMKGSLWLNGVAMYYIVQADEFFHPFWTKLIINSDLLITATTYFTMIWELVHPFLIWIRQCRLILITFAIIFHLGTIFIMGLTAFGVIMIMLNLIFLTDNHLNIIREKTTSIFKSIDLKKTKFFFTNQMLTTIKYLLHIKLKGKKNHESSRNNRRSKK